MRHVRPIILGILIALTASSAFGGGCAWKLPDIVVGTGGLYEISNVHGFKSELTYAIVGKTTVGGKTGYWIETRTKIPSGALMVTKMLTVYTSTGLDPQQLIMQMPGRPPMEFPPSFMARMKTEMSRMAVTCGSVKIGTSTVTVPAGTFVCDHYRTTTAPVVDSWASKSGPVFGLIKAISPTGTIELEKSLTGQKSMITGTPVPMPMGPGAP